MSTISKSLFDRVGGLKTLEKVHKDFYDKAYAHPWLSQYFTDKPQQILEDQQTAFMAQLIGGPKAYGGKTPKMAHQHMYITEELFALRRSLLSEAISENHISDEVREEWLTADSALKNSIIKKSPEDCKRAYNTQEILNFAKPN